MKSHICIRIKIDFIESAVACNIMKMLTIKKDIVEAKRYLKSLGIVDYKIDVRSVIFFKGLTVVDFRSIEDYNYFKLVSTTDDYYEPEIEKSL